jgi:hypothetical protein
VILEEETIITEPVADPQQDEYNPPMVDQPPEISPEQIETLLVRKKALLQ